MGHSQPRRIEEVIARELLIMVGSGVVAIAQAALIPSFFGFSPALLLILVVSRVLVGSMEPHPDHGFVMALRWSFYGGIVLDVCASTLLGAHALALLAVTIILHTVVGQLRVEGILLTLIAMLLGGLIYEVVLMIIYSNTIVDVPWGQYFLTVIAPSLLVTLVPSLPVFFLFKLGIYLLPQSSDAQQRQKMSFS
jgi:rod shape-determining protein MreD